MNGDDAGKGGAGGHNNHPSMFDRLVEFYRWRRDEVLHRHRRSLPFGDLIADRHEKARHLGFGEGTTCYDNVLIIGTVTVGRHCWIGPNVILDGSGGLDIGDHCDISTGVQIYSHHTVRRVLSGGVEPIERAATRIGSCVFIGPQTVIEKGTIVGDRVVIGAFSLVNRSIPSDCRAWGQPARIIIPNVGSGTEPC